MRRREHRQTAVSASPLAPLPRCGLDEETGIYCFERRVRPIYADFVDAAHPWILAQYEETPRFAHMTRVSDLVVEPLEDGTVSIATVGRALPAWCSEEQYQLQSPNRVFAGTFPARQIGVITSPPASSLQFLDDGGQQPQQVATQIASFLAGAQKSLDVAVYDSGLTGELADIVRGAFDEARGRGVAIRLAYHADTERTKGVPAPSSQTQVFVESLGVPNRAVGSKQNLMHHKYVIRDAGTDTGAVLTGSTNWGEDAWSREENVILELFGSELAQHYHLDFEEVWAGETENSGHGAGGSAELWFDDQPMPADVWFAPAEGPAMAHAAATVIAHATKRIVIASPVLTSGSVLGTLNDLIARQSVPVRGIVDRTQMEEVLQQWAENPHASWKNAAFESVARGAGLVGKRSTPWSPQAVHDYMHLKMIVVDDSVLTGSFNFSHSGEDNAENLLRLDSAPFAQVCADFIDHLIARYADTPAIGPA